MWTFFEKAQVPRSFGRIARNYAETVPFHKIFTPGNQMKLRYFIQSTTWNANVRVHRRTVCFSQHFVHVLNELSLITLGHLIVTTKNILEEDRWVRKPHASDSASQKPCLLYEYLLSYSLEVLLNRLQVTKRVPRLKI